MTIDAIGRPTSALPTSSPGPMGTDHDRLGSKPGMDETEREAVRAVGMDPDDPAVVAAMDFVAWELSMLGR
jgi:hypothetical protein